MKKATRSYLIDHFRGRLRNVRFLDVVRSYLAFLEACDTPISLGVALRLKYECYNSYLDMQILPAHYNDIDAFRIDYQCIKGLSKAEFFPAVYDVRKEAERNFIQAELACSQTNDRLIQRVDPLFADPAVNEVLHLAKRKIAICLKDVPEVESIPFRFGPGNNIGLSKNTSVLDKLDSTLTHTREILGLLPSVLGTCPSWVSYLSDGKIPTAPTLPTVGCVEVIGSKLGFVPKNAKTDRAICTEPLLNSFIQLGIGRVLRNRLRGVGCNLNTQRFNQQSAQFGSITNKLATIDLKAASDTISYMTVLELLPLPWFNLLDTARSHRYTYEGKNFSFEKFSSMGNGFTFELETLIFLAITRACCDVLDISSRPVNAYGDDIIVPQAAVPLLVQSLKLLGFEVNNEKSFADGPFRESCGSDFFLGVDVRPLFMKKSPTPQVLYTWINHIRRKFDVEYDHRYKAWEEALMSLLPWQFRSVIGPDGYGDGHLIVDYNALTARKHSYLSRGWEGKAYFTLSSTPLHSRYSGRLLYVAALYAAQYSGQSSISLHKFETYADQDYYLTTSRDRVRTTLRYAYSHRR